MSLLDILFGRPQADGPIVKVDFDPAPGSIFTDVATASIGANTGVQLDLQAVVNTLIISVTIKNETRPTADPRDAFVITGPEKGARGVTHGVKYASRFNDAHWRFDPPIKLKKGEFMSLLAHGENNDAIGFQWETSESLKNLGRTTS